MQKPKISQDFTVEDIRKIREYDAEQMAEWTAEEIIKDTQNKTREILKHLEQNKARSKNEK